MELRKNADLSLGGYLEKGIEKLLLRKGLRLRVGQVLVYRDLVYTWTVRTGCGCDRVAGVWNATWGSKSI